MIEIRLFGNFDGKNQMLYCKPMEVCDNELTFTYPGFSHYDGEADELKIMLSLPRKDKNGKQIFVGDICRSDWGYCCCIGEVKIDSFYYAEGECIISDNIEVVGNIYENPELLK